MKVFPPLCGLLLFAVAISAEEIKPAPPPLSPDGTPPAESQDKWQHLASRQLQEYVRNLLYDSNFDELDAIATELNNKQIRYNTGTWKLHTFFEAVTTPRQQSDLEDWKVLFQRLQEWDDRSHSAFSTGAVGHTQLNYAWHVRTGKWASQVSAEQWQVFNDGVTRSLTTYNRVLKYPEKCADTYEQLLRIGLAQGWPEERMQATLREGIAVIPDYYPSFEVFGFYTLERWYGKPGDTRKYLKSILTMVPGDKGYGVYTRTAYALWPYCKEGFFAVDGGGTVDWPTMKKGFEWIVRTYPNERVMKNRFAAYACLAKDRQTARTLLDDIQAKSEFDYEAWLPAGGFETGKKWILESD